jgi:S-(hydroxymethyl)glutathione dehydrogenase / alcohol dehydrogenase
MLCKVKSARAAVLARSREPLVVDYIEFPDELGVGQVLVKVLHTTICGAQLNEIGAVKGPDKFLPHLLGHEASGQVIDVGLGVTSVRPGDAVVMHWRPSLGIQSKPPSYRWRDQPLNAGWIATFAEAAIISENRLTVVSSNMDMKLAPLLGCALTTAMGVVNNDAKIKVGESVVVFGVGGVGLPIVQFAALAGAHPIVAVDVVETKLATARKYGATYTFNPQFCEVPSLGALRSIVGSQGPDKVIETTGLKSSIELAYDLTHQDGICVLVGVPLGKVTISTLPLHFNKVLTGSHGGDAKPHIDIPRILKLMGAGRISFAGLITHEFKLDQINEALDMVRDGAAGRVLVSMD